MRQNIIFVSDGPVVRENTRVVPHSVEAEHFSLRTVPRIRDRTVVTILATSVLERMCTSDPQMRYRLRLCGRRLVWADSSPLTVKGELELTVVFPGLSCDMLLVVASIRSDGLLGTAVVLAISAGSANGAIVGRRSSTLQLHQQTLTPDVKASLTWEGDAACRRGQVVST